MTRLAIMITKIFVRHNTILIRKEVNVYIDIGKIKMTTISTKNNNVTLTRRTWILVWIETTI